MATTKISVHKQDLILTKLMHPTRDATKKHINICREKVNESIKQITDPEVMQVMNKHTNLLNSFIGYLYFSVPCNKLDEYKDDKPTDREKNVLIDNIIILKAPSTKSIKYLKKAGITDVTKVNVIQYLKICIEPDVYMEIQKVLIDYTNAVYKETVLRNRLQCILKTLNTESKLKNEFPEAYEIYQEISKYDNVVSITGNLCDSIESIRAELKKS